MKLYVMNAILDVEHYRYRNLVACEQERKRGEKPFQRHKNKWVDNTTPAIQALKIFAFTVLIGYAAEGYTAAVSKSRHGYQLSKILAPQRRMPK